MLNETLVSVWNVSLLNQIRSFKLFDMKSDIQTFVCLPIRSKPPRWKPNRPTRKISSESDKKSRASKREQQQRRGKISERISESGGLVSKFGGRRYGSGTEEAVQQTETISDREVDVQQARAGRGLDQQRVPTEAGSG